MYSEKLVTVIKHNGRVLRETDGAVHIPFGSEYTLLFKNLNSVRALVRVEIDGVDATDGSLIVPANGSVELKRFIENGNFERGHRFKFIERTKKIEDGPRGIGAEDGLIRVEFEFEREPAKILNEEIIRRKYVDEYWNHARPWYPLWNSTCSISDTLARSAIPVSTAGIESVTYGTHSSTYNSVAGDTEKALAYAATAMFDSSVVQQNVSLNNVGITVKGSECDQKFVAAAQFPTDGQKHVMILKLLGTIGQAITVKTKTECQTCGTKNTFGAKFCSECGTSLVHL